MSFKIIYQKFLFDFLIEDCIMLEMVNAIQKFKILFSITFSVEEIIINKQKHECQWRDGGYPATN